MLAQIIFELLQKCLARRAVFRALRGKREDAAEVVSSDKEVARKTAAIIKRIARCFGQLERFALALRHFGSVDDRRRRCAPFRFRGLRAGFFSDLFFRRFQRGLHDRRNASAYPPDKPTTSALQYDFAQITRRSLGPPVKMQRPGSAGSPSGITRTVTLRSFLICSSTARDPFQWASAKPPWISGLSAFRGVKKS